MSENKFTPGEWSYFYNEEGGYSIGSDMNKDTEQLIGFVIPDETYSEKSDYIEAEANAKLIAAAPELLEALKNCYVRLRSLEGKWELTGEDDQYKAYSAIKKATS